MPKDPSYEAWIASLLECPPEVYAEALSKAEVQFRNVRKIKNQVDLDDAKIHLEKAKSDVLDEIKKFRRAQPENQMNRRPLELMFDVFRFLKKEEIQDCRLVNLYWRDVILNQKTELSEGYDHPAEPKHVPKFSSWMEIHQSFMALMRSLIQDRVINLNIQPMQRRIHRRDRETRAIFEAFVQTAKKEYPKKLTKKFVQSLKPIQYHASPKKTFQKLHQPNSRNH